MELREQATDEYGLTPIIC